MFKNPFSAQGRIRRMEYGISLILFYIVAYMIGAMMEAIAGGAVFIFFAIYIAGVWFMYAQGAKRCHDLGHNGWWQIIPFYGLWMLFADGKPGFNKYGPNPKFIGQWEADQTTVEPTVK